MKRLSFASHSATKTPAAATTDVKSGSLLRPNRLFMWMSASIRTQIPLGAVRLRNHPREARNNPSVLLCCERRNEI